MIRVLGWLSICCSIAIISYCVGREVALYHASLDDLVEAARLRLGYYVGVNQ